MKNIWFLMLFLLLFATGCVMVPPASEGTENGSEQGAPTYKDPTHSMGTYTVTFKMGPSTIKHKYELGEMPEPPTFEDYVMNTVTLKHTGWEEEFVAVDGNRTYYATYEKITNTATITLITKNGTIQTETAINTLPKIPEIEDYQGMKFIGFDKEISICTKSETYTAVYSNIYSIEAMHNLLNFSLAAYPSALGATDDGNGIHDKCFALYALAHHEHESPQDGIVSAKIVSHLENVVAPNNAPSFDLWTNWSYSVMSASIALAKDTPTVWGKLSDDVKARLDTMMECFAYIESLGTSDENEFRTGPGLLGNYSKTWNPNYRLGNVGVMVFVTHYFGNGDLSAGAKEVNRLLNGFNEEKYEQIIGRFIRYQWVRATNVWQTDGRTDSSGKLGCGARELLLYGTRGERSYCSYKNGDKEKITASTGTGVGVNNAGCVYQYHSIPLERADEILLDIISFNYSGGAVKNEHYYDLNGDETPDLIGGLREGISSPYLGQVGMMLEFASANRSSASYCRGDFLLANSLVSAGVALGIVDPEQSGEIFKKMTVGNEDFLFKYQSGYNSYSEGSYGVSIKTDYEASYKGKQYFAIKELWAWMKTEYMPSVVPS